MQHHSAFSWSHVHIVNDNLLPTMTSIVDLPFLRPTCIISASSQHDWPWLPLTGRKPEVIFNSSPGISSRATSHHPADTLCCNTTLACTCRTSASSGCPPEPQWHSLRTEVCPAISTVSINIASQVVILQQKDCLPCQEREWPKHGFSSPPGADTS